MSNPPNAIKRVDQSQQYEKPSVDDALNLHKELQYYSNIFNSHRIGQLWTLATGYQNDAFHCQIPLTKSMKSQALDELMQIGFDYALQLCLADPNMKWSGPISEEQSDWFRNFGRRHNGMLAINPLDKILEYDKYFGNKIEPERIAYSPCIPERKVLCFSWLKAGYMHIKFNDNGIADVWMKYSSQIDTSGYKSLYDIGDNDEAEICDSMLVDILGLAGHSTMDILLNEFI